MSVSALILLTPSALFDEAPKPIRFTVIPSRIFCADWGTDACKRAVYVADVSARSVQRIGSDEWSLTSVVDAARRHGGSGPVLVTFDVPIGVPNSYLSAARDRFSCTITNFLDLLIHASKWRRFLTPTDQANRWRFQQPFFKVPQETGGLTAYISAAAKRGVICIGTLKG